MCYFSSLHTEPLWTCRKVNFLQRCFLFVCESVINQFYMSLPRAVYSVKGKKETHGSWRTAGCVWVCRDCYHSVLMFQKPNSAKTQINTENSGEGPHVNLTTSAFTHRSINTSAGCCINSIKKGLYSHFFFLLLDTFLRVGPEWSRMLNIYCFRQHPITENKNKPLAFPQYISHSHYISCICFLTLACI